MMRRGEHQIVENILELCKNPVSVTMIVYQCNLNFRTVHPHVNKLVAAKLVEEIPVCHKKLYQITPKGLEALAHIQAFKDLLKPLK